MTVMTRRERYWLLVFLFNLVAFYSVEIVWIQLVNFAACLLSGILFWSYGEKDPK